MFVFVHKWPTIGRLNVGISSCRKAIRESVIRQKQSSTGSHITAVFVDFVNYGRLAVNFALKSALANLRPSVQKFRQYAFENNALHIHFHYSGLSNFYALISDIASCS